jgi:hypothetical protein
VDAHEFALESTDLQRKFDAENALVGVLQNINDTWEGLQCLEMK